MKTICKECSFISSNIYLYQKLCDAKEAPIHDFISGYKFCNKINKTGNCKYYKEKVKIDECLFIDEKGYICKVTSFGVERISVKINANI